MLIDLCYKILSQPGEKSSQRTNQTPKVTKNKAFSTFSKTKHGYKTLNNKENAQTLG